MIKFILKYISYKRRYKYLLNKYNNLDIEFNILKRDFN